MVSSQRPRVRRGILAPIVGMLLFAAPGLAGAHQFTDWGTATLESGINSAQADGCPIESPNGLRLFIASTRPGAIGGDTDPNDIWVADRASVDAPWSAPAHLPAPVNSGAADFCPTPLNGKRLLFVSARSVTGSCGAGDMYLTRDHPVRGWETPTNLGCVASGTGPNFSGGEFSPSLVETSEGTLLYFSSAGSSGTLQDIYVSRQNPDGSFASPTAVTELNTGGFNDQMPNVSRDGLEMVFASDRPGGTGAMDIYVTTRATTADAWDAPQNLGPAVNTAAAETRPSLSGDGERLHFGRLGDIWFSTRNQITGSN